VSFLGESLDEGHATVRTTVLGRTGQELPIDYRMVERGDRWAVRDVVIDGVSLAANYRAQFTRVIQTSSYPELVRQLQLRVSAPPLVASASPENRSAPDALGASSLTSPGRSGAPSPARDAAKPPAAPLPRLIAVTTPETRSFDVTPRGGSAPGRTDGAGSGSTTRQEPFSPWQPSGQIIRPPSVAPTHPASPPASRPAVYWVQVAAFKSHQAAMRLASLLRGDKASSSYRSADQWAVITTSGPDVARVRVGPFADRAEAELSLRQLEGRGFKPFIAEDRERAR
jgi:cell division septation protein DedD